ncbi:hypothetical protein CRE_29231 [Caenorhabditis remanei]|uniref:Uncharacterized protein n=1 Tax=Caenorhabditis remanei TaxID=31234 RepID=E3NKI4_CAERE|nr:hypothetical protein CRE_29231 [Caenorhabditis remanei]
MGQSVEKKFRKSENRNIPTFRKSENPKFGQFRNSEIPKIRNSEYSDIPKIRISDNSEIPKFRNSEILKLGHFLVSEIPKFPVRTPLIWTSAVVLNVFVLVQLEMEPNALDLTKTLTRHPDGFFVARVVVGYLKKGSVEETMILIDPCLAASDDKESVFHFAISENRMEYREDGEFKKIARARPAETTGCAHLVQVAVGTWEQRASVGAACLCSCHPLFYDDSAAHDQVQHCELRYLAAHIAVQLRTNADLRELTLPARPACTLY